MLFAIAILLPLVTLAIISFLVIRLQLISPARPEGRTLLFASAALILFAVIWQVVKPLPIYSTWFLASAFSMLDWLHLGVTLLAAILGAFGTVQYYGWWQARLDAYRQREWASSLLVTLHEQSREPKHLLEFLNGALGSCLQEGVDAAAVFFVNRGRRQFVLATATGFSREETARLEYYPLDRNPLGQSVELEEALVSDLFLFIDPSGMQTASRFHSTMILPLVAGQEKVGMLLLLSQQPKAFSRGHVRSLIPVAGWLAERIRTARLQRELNGFKEQQEQSAAVQNDLANRLHRGLTAFAAQQPINEFSEALVGFAGVSDVQVCAIIGGSVTLLGNSNHSYTEWSENYRAALANALDGSKPLIINQEGTTADGRSYLVASTVVFPAPHGNQKLALLLRKENSAVVLSELELRYLGLYGTLAANLLLHQQVQQLDFSRRKGFDAIVKLIRNEAVPTITHDPSYFARQFAPVLRAPSGSITIMRGADNLFAPISSSGIPYEKVESLRFEPGEVLLENPVSSSEVRFAADRTEVRSVLEQLSIPNREVLNKLAASYGLPDMLAVCPLIAAGSVRGFTLFVFYDVSSAERGEWKRLLTLAVGLFTLRQSIGESYTALPAAISGSASAVEPAVLNDVNNHLSIVIGSADLASRRDDVTGEIRNYFTGIVEEAERAAQKIRTLSGAKSESASTQSESAAASGDLNRSLLSTLSGSRISDTLYMIAGRPREIFTKLGELPPVHLMDETIAQFATEALNRFASLAEDEDVITVSTYVKDQSAYLDISRHRKNFPPVDQVAGFGKYLKTNEAVRFRPADTFLRKLTDEDSWYAFDTYSAAPSYLSFKFPLAHGAKESNQQKAVRILAIDDQPVILDLISAMCISLGYTVRTAATGEEGIRLAEAESFDMVLTDLAMPGLSGLETARRIHGRHPHTPIILVTGWEASVSAADLASAGIARVLYKPFRIEQLTELIQSFVENRSFV